MIVHARLVVNEWREGGGAEWRQLRMAARARPNHLRRGRRRGARDGVQPRQRCPPHNPICRDALRSPATPLPYLLIPQMSEHGRSRENDPFSPIHPCCITFLLTGLIQHGRGGCDVNFGLRQGHGLRLRPTRELPSPPNVPIRSGGQDPQRSPFLLPSRRCWNLREAGPPPSSRPRAPLLLLIPTLPSFFSSLRSPPSSRPCAPLLLLVPTLCVGTGLLAAPRPLLFRARRSGNLPRVANPREVRVRRPGLDAGASASPPPRRA